MVGVAATNLCHDRPVIPATAGLPNPGVKRILGHATGRLRHDGKSRCGRRTLAGAERAAGGEASRAHPWIIAHRQRDFSNWRRRSVRTRFSRIALTKNGDILISSKNSTMKGPGDVVIKGQKILEN
jgi:hypothetical protein